MGDQLASSSDPGVFFLYEGGEVAGGLRSKITHVRIGPHVTIIPDDAFLECSNLVEVEFNAGLKAIGGGAFRRCTALRSVTIPSSVTELRQGAFNSCTHRDTVERGATGY